MPAIVRFTDPAGAVTFLCHDAPGHTQDPAAAVRFVSDAVAYRAANAAIYGDPNAFWNSERESAKLARDRMSGWRATVEEAAPLGC